MNCDFTYCIYNDDYHCILDEVRMNALGMCDDCITISFPQEVLDEYKHNQLHEILSGYEDSD